MILEGRGVYEAVDHCGPTLTYSSRVEEVM